MDCIGFVFRGVGQLFGSIERAVNSPEHNFKNDLDRMLKDFGMPSELRKTIKDYLNEGRDEDLTQKLQDLMATGVIPPDAAPAIAELAQKNGVPPSSINQGSLMTPTDPVEAGNRLGQRFGFEAADVKDEPQAPRRPTPKHWMQA